MRRHQFTIIEIIAVLVVIGILGAIGTMGLGAGVRGYIQGRDRLDAIQKAQNALQRMVVELRFLAFDANTGALSLVVAEDGASATYTSRRDLQAHVLAQSGSELLLDGKILMDKVHEFEITYSSETGEVVLRLVVVDAGEFVTSLYP